MPEPTGTASPQTPTSSAATAAPGPRPATDHSTRRLLLATLAVPLVLLLMLLAFFLPSHASSASHLPLSVSGPQQQVSTISTALETTLPGVFDVSVEPSAEAVADAVENRASIGGITVTDSGIEVLEASGNGSAYTTILTNLATALETRADAAALTAAQASGADAAALAALQEQLSATRSVTVTDVAPLPAKDPMGVTITSLALPLVFGGMASGAVLTIVIRAHAWKRIAAALAIAALGSLVVVAALHAGFRTLQGDVALEWLSLALGICSISLTLIGLHRVLGVAGLGIGAALMVFLANPLAGIVAGPWYLPAGWGALGQLMPVGAAGTLLRSAAYFDGAGAGASAWVLVAWCAAGLLLTALGAGLARRQGRAATPAV
ncbi:MULTISPECIES: ABC transporter permease [Actinomyces]|uniref:ABC transporter permease n=1 Tax=Actinomyces respiraculi TaxID=2744574 RepID=A0A7T0LKZ0_9ACTO|nr:MULTISPECIES: ABC transporter permease [Actinomyces]QPL05532.1 ABC transporter permease [Actinomyces respiraculi]